MTDAPMTMLERAAVALADEGDWPSEQEWLTELALATIRAIREPDERVIEAMAAALVRPTLLMGGAPSLAKRQALAIWRAGIDAALEGRHD